MTDMTLNVSQVQNTQSTPKSGSSKSSSTKGESFSEKLDRAVSDNNVKAAEQQNNDKAEEIGGEMAAEMLVDAVLMPIVPTADTTEQPVITTDAVQNTEGAVSDMAAVPEMPAVDASVSQPEQVTQPMQPEQAVSSDFPTMPDTVEKIEIIPSDRITAEEAADGDNTDEAIDSFRAQTQFTKSIQQAQHLIRNSEGNLSLRSQIVKIDVDELQKKVDSGEYLAQAQAANQPVHTEQTQFEVETPENIEPREIFSQIKEGAQPHIANNDSDFTVKLRPEGLGEITVKLVSQDGRVTLSLSASDPNVQKMLGSEINNLREIMRPYNVEVAQVEESNSAVFADLQQQLQQQSSQQQYQQQGQGQSRFFTTDYTDITETVEEEDELLQPDSVLDQYI